MPILGPFNNVPTGSTYFLQSTGVLGDLILGPGAGGTGTDALSIRGKPIGTAIPTGAQALVFNGTAYVPTNLPGTPLSVFGMIPNDWNACVANSNAWDALMDSIPNTDQGQGIHLYVDDKYHFARPLDIRRQVRMSGNGGTGNSRGSLIFPNGMNMLVLEIDATSSDSGSSINSVVEFIDINVDIPSTLTTTRPSNSNVVAGHFYKIPSENRYYLLCTQSGHTASSLPAALTVGNPSYAPLPLATVTDGTAHWSFMFYGYDTTSNSNDLVRVWKPSHSYNVGDITRRFLDGRVCFICTVAGTSDTTIPVDFAFPVELPTQTITDGGVTWQTYVMAGVNVRAPLCTIANINVGGFTSTCCYFAQGTIPAFSDNCRFYNLGAQSYNGGTPSGGFFIGGDDSNGCIIQGCRFAGLGLGHDGATGLGYWYHGLSGDVFINCYTDSSLGRGFVDDSIAGGLYVNCVSENYFKSTVGSAIVIGGNMSSPFGYRGASTWLPAHGGVDANGIRDTNRGSIPNTYTVLGPGNASAYSFATGYESANPFEWFYQVGPDNSASDHAWHFGLHPNNYNTAAMTVGGSRSLQGPNSLWLRNGGVYLGEQSFGRRFIGANPHAQTDKNIAGGIRTAGDRFPRSTNPTPGEYYNNLCYQNGTDAIPWAAANPRFASTYFGQYGISFADQYRDGSFVLTCTKSGITGSSQPTLPATYDATPAKVWVASQRYSFEEIVRPAAAGFSGNGFKYSAKTPNTATPTQADPGFTIWAPNTQYYANSIVAATTNSGTAIDTFFTLKAFEWAPGDDFFIGQIVTPSAAYAGTSAYNRCFKMIAVQIAGTVIYDDLWGRLGVVGSTEPVWPTDGTSTVDDGSCRWQEVAMMSAATGVGNTRLTAAGNGEPFWNDTTQAGPPINGGQTLDGVDETEFYWTAFNLISNATETSSWFTNGDPSPDNPDAVTLGDGGFGLTWILGDADDPTSRVADNTAEWSKSAIAAQYIQSEKQIIAGMNTLSSTPTAVLGAFDAFYELIKVPTGTTTVDLTAAAKAGDSFAVWNAGAAAVNILPGTVSIPTGTTYNLISDGITIRRLQ